MSGKKTLLETFNNYTGDVIDIIVITGIFVAIFACSIVMIMQSIKNLKDKYFKSMMNLITGILIIIICIVIGISMYKEEFPEKP